MSKTKLKQLIENIVENQMLSEEEPPEPADDGLDLGVDMPDVADDSGDEGLDLGDDMPDGDGDLGGDLGDDLGDDDDMPDLDGAGGGGGGLGGGLGGGGGGFGGGGGSDIEMGDEEASAPAADSGSGDSYEEGESLQPDDPEKEIMEMAVELLDFTRDDQQILNAIKSSIQDHYEDFSDAKNIIHSLWTTEDPTLRVVARKLLLFIKGK